MENEKNLKRRQGAHFQLSETRTTPAEMRVMPSHAARDTFSRRNMAALRTSTEGSCDRRSATIPGAGTFPAPLVECPFSLPRRRLLVLRADFQLHRGQLLFVEQAVAVGRRQAGARAIDGFLREDERFGEFALASA